MTTLPTPMTNGELARLLPVVKDSSKEDRATSILLATFRAVPAFSKSMLASIEKKVGKYTTVSCYTQVVLDKPKDAKLRPDGLIRIERSGKTWTALVEAKIGSAALEKDQLQAYIDLAKVNGIDAIITISNDFCTLPTHHPIGFNKNEKKAVELYHWSWLHAVTKALLIQQSEDIQDPTQRFILDEFLRYFEHDSVGVKGFVQMNPEWKMVVQAVLNGAVLRKTADETKNTVSAWHQESRDLCLIMSRELGVAVREKMPQKHMREAAARLRDDVDVLVNNYELRSTLDIPDAAALLEITANLARRSISCSMKLAAPTDKKTNKPQVTWLLRQLSKACGETIQIRAWHKSATNFSQASLNELREDPSVLVSEGKEKILFARFEIVVVSDLAGKFSGSKTFIQELEMLVPDFYSRIGQQLRAWVAPPPKLLAHESEQGMAAD